MRRHTNEQALVIACALLIVTCVLSFVFWYNYQCFEIYGDIVRCLEM